MRPSDLPSRILVCEDNSLLADLLGHHLAEGGFAVDYAVDGGEAIEKIARGRFDAVVLDAMMPVCSGFDVLRRMKEDPATAEIPVIMLTGLSQDEDVRNALTLGVSEFMIKPFIPEELILRLRRLLEGEGAAPAVA